jgi:predicted 3-demethylubiquinone-9 3-methyltransferase (glyoxalase superfamily)
MEEETCMEKIVPNLWFDDNAEEAVRFYTSVFDNSRTNKTARYDSEGAKVSGQPEGSVLTVEFELEGYRFIALNGGPVFSFTPAISFMVACDTKEKVDRLWTTLSEGGTELMALDTYPFSERYGWVQDKYGLSWQIMFMGDREIKQLITPTLMYVGDMAGKAEEAIGLYTGLFDDSKIENVMRYDAGEEPDKEGTIKHASFQLAGEYFAAMDSAHEHNFTFTEAISLMVNCDTQEEIDKYWQALSYVPESEQCGWLKDKFGVSWQIVPRVLNELLADSDPVKAKAAMKAMLAMHKLDIAELQRAHDEV